MDNQEQIQAWRQSIQRYKDTHSMLYNGKLPSEKLKESFCQINKIPWPLPRVEEPGFQIGTLTEMIFGGELEG